MRERERDLNPPTHLSILSLSIISFPPFQTQTHPPTHPPTHQKYQANGQQDGLLFVPCKGALPHGTSQLWYRYQLQKLRDMSLQQAGSNGVEESKGGGGRGGGGQQQNAPRMVIEAMEEGMEGSLPQNVLRQAVYGMGVDMWIELCEYM